MPSRDALPDAAPVDDNAVAADRIILLNGASSSGKSTVARLLQASLDEPFLYLSSDQLVDSGARPTRRQPSGPFDWVGSMRPKFFDGFHGSIAAMAGAGNDLVVEHIIVAEIDRRERARGDRRTGEGRSHIQVNRVHEFGSYDLEIDTTDGVHARVAEQIIQAWTSRSPVGALLRTGDDGA